MKHTHFVSFKIFEWIVLYFFNSRPRRLCFRLFFNSISIEIYLNPKVHCDVLLCAFTLLKSCYYFSSAFCCVNVQELKIVLHVTLHHICMKSVSLFQSRHKNLFSLFTLFRIFWRFFNEKWQTILKKYV